MTFIKRAFGANTCALVLFLVAFTFLHPLFSKTGTFHWQFLLALPLYWLLWVYGFAWMRNHYDLNLIAIDKDNEHVKRATQLAQKNIAKLTAALSDPRNGCFLKAGLKTRTDSVEHIWCEAHTYQGDRIWCSIANQPQDLDEQYLNVRFPLALTDIEDFIITGTQPSIGGYSLMACAQTLLDQGYNLSSKQKELLRAHSAYAEWGFPAA